MSEPFERLDWDSKFFESSIARVTQTQPQSIRNATLLARDSGIECLYLLIGGDDFDARDAAVSSGFQCVGARVTYQTDLLELDAPSIPSGLELVPAQAEHLPHLEALARASFEESRFFWDLRFPRERAEELYATWARKSVCDGYADAVFVLVDGRTVAGFVTLDVSDGIGQIGLIAVDPGARGRGVGTALLQSAHQFYGEQGARRAKVVTHGTNVPAQRLYTRHGYKIESSETWFHWWRSNDATDRV